MVERYCLGRHKALIRSIESLSKIKGLKKNSTEINFPGLGSIKNDYYVYNPDGKPPTALLVSGVHGNELQTIHSLIRYLRKNIASMPNFIYIPLASPTGVGMETEHNGFGSNLNREFQLLFNDEELTADPEALLIKKIIKEFPDLEAVFTFHMDWERKREFYFYFHSNNEQRMLDLRYLFKDTKKFNIEPFTGKDDEHDSALNHTATQGFVGTTTDGHSDGSLEDWIIRSRRAKYAITFESPFALTDQEIDGLTESYFKRVIFPLISDKIIV